MRWLHRRRENRLAEATAALVDAEAQLASAKAAQRKLEPLLKRLEKQVAENRIFESVVATMTRRPS